MDIFSRAHRILKHLDRYIDLSAGARLPVNAPETPSLTMDEQPVGAYINDDKEFTNLLFLSTRGVYIYRQQQWEFVPYDSVATTCGPEHKVDVSGFTLL